MFLQPANSKQLVATKDYMLETNQYDQTQSLTKLSLPIEIKQKRILNDNALNYLKWFQFCLPHPTHHNPVSI